MKTAAEVTLYLAVGETPDGALRIIRTQEMRDDYADHATRLMMSGQLIARAMAELLSDEADPHLATLAEAAACLDAAVKNVQAQAYRAVRRMGGEA
jgi:hypothetical protein